MIEDAAAGPKKRRPDIPRGPSTTTDDFPHFDHRLPYCVPSSKNFLGWAQIQPWDASGETFGRFSFIDQLTVRQFTLARSWPGLSLYLVAAGLPLAGYITWAAIPGHVAAPFQVKVFLAIFYRLPHGG